MQNILSGHHTVDLNLSDKINKCVQYHARVHHMDFANMTLYSRKQLVQLLASLYNLHGMKPTIHRVRLTDNRIAVLPTFAIRSMLYSILTDSSLMRPENIAPNYSLFTGQPTRSVSHLDEVYTGWAWKEALEFHCGDKTDILPLGLVCFYDKPIQMYLAPLPVYPFLQFLHSSMKSVGCALTSK